MSSGGDNKRFKNEIQTHKPQRPGFEKLSHGSGLEIQHNFNGNIVNEIMMGTINSNGGNSEDQHHNK